MCVSKKIVTVIAAVSHQMNSDQIVAVLQRAAIAIESSLTLNEIKIYKELKFSAWVWCSKPVENVEPQFREKKKILGENTEYKVARAQITWLAAANQSRF